MPWRFRGLFARPPIRQVKYELVNVYDCKFKVATKSTLLKMKKAAKRSKDQIDIQRLEEALRNEKRNEALSPEQALEFLEEMQKLTAEIEEATKPISLRVPGNILRSFKALAASQEKAYQAMMIDALRLYLTKSRG